MHATTEVLYQLIYPNLNRELLLADLNPKRQNNNEYIQLDCPGCFYKQEAFIKDSFYIIKCNRRNNCGIEISIWDYVQKKYTTENNKETLEKLASLAGIELPKLSEQDLIVIEKSQKTSSLINTVQSYFIDQLWSPVGTKALEYLIKTRGYTENQIRIMGIGFNPGYQQTHEHLLNNHALLTANVTDKLNFIEYRDNHPITFLHRDIHGKPLTIWGRTLQQDEKDKYKPYANSAKETPFNLYKARNLNDQILVEGYFCSMIAHAHGLYNVTAVNTNSITTAQIETLKQTKAKRIYLAFGHDKAGKAGTKKSIELLLEHNFDVFIVNYPAEYTDVDQYIIKADINFFKKDVDQAISSAKWLSEYIISQHDYTTDTGRKDCINEILRTAKLIQSSTDQIDFINQSKNVLNLTDEHIKTYQVALQEQAIQEQFDKETKLYIDTIQKLLYEKRFDEIASVPKPKFGKERSLAPFKLLFIKDTNFLSTKAPVMPALTWSINGKGETTFIPKGIVSSLVGAGGVGKTHWCMQLAMSIATGSAFLQKYNCNKGNVAVFLGENSNDDIHRLIEKTVDGFCNKKNDTEKNKIYFDVGNNLTITSVMGLNASIINEEATRTAFYHELLQELIDKEPINGWDLIIIDPAARFLGPKAEIDNSAATAFIASLENIFRYIKGKPTIFFAHHMSKNSIGSSNSDSTASRGASGLTDGARMQINLKRIDEPGSINHDKIEMKVVKTNHTARPEAEYITTNYNGHLTIENNMINKNDNRSSQVNDNGERVIAKAKMTQLKM